MAGASVEVRETAVAGVVMNAVVMGAEKWAASIETVLDLEEGKWGLVEGMMALADSMVENSEVTMAEADLAEAQALAAAPMEDSMVEELEVTMADAELAEAEAIAKDGTGVVKRGACRRT